MFVYQVFYTSKPEGGFYPKARTISGVIEIQSERRVEKMKNPERYLANMVLNKRPELNQVSIEKYKFLKEE